MMFWKRKVCPLMVTENLRVLDLHGYNVTEKTSFSLDNRKLNERWA